jgi:ribosomal-protein-alanine N-acetyltransferase
VPKIKLESPTLSHSAEFLKAVAASRDLHTPWASPPATPAAFRAYLDRLSGPRDIGYLVRTLDGQLAGVINISEIVRGAFKSAYLGYYGFAPLTGRGYMSAGLLAVLRVAFGRHRLHRLEANIQPDNLASKRLVRGLGFRREGVSRRYLKIGGRWRDHERWAILAEDMRRQ